MCWALVMRKLRLSKSCISELEKSAVNRVLDRGFFGMGQEVMTLRTI